MLQLVFLLICPLIVAVAVALVAWNALRSPWKLVLAATFSLYALYGLVIYLFGPNSVGFSVHALEPGSQGPEEPLFVFLEPYYRAILAFAILCVPVVLALLKLFKRQAMRSA